jgi:DNA mismatch repair protein MutS2
MPILTRYLQTLEFDKILELLRQRCTFSATEALVHDLLPSTELSEVTRRQNATEEARRLLEVRPNTGVRGARDIRGHVRRASVGGSLNPSELLDVAGTIGAGRSVRTLLERQEVRVPTLARLAQHITNLDELEATIRNAIDDEGQVLDGASERLRHIRQEMRQAYDRLMRRLNELIASSAFRDALQDPVVTMRGGRYVVPVKADFRGRVRGIIHDQSASGATFFIEPLPIVELTNTWRQHGIEEEREIERVLKELSERVHAAQYGLLDTVDALAAIDLAFAMGKLAIEMEATRPLLNKIEPPRPDPLPTGGGAVGRGGAAPTPAGRHLVARLIGARHPLLRGDVVPIDVDLGDQFDVLLITGPNTGGKTVALKTVGLLAAMAQAGLQIPALEGSSLAVFSGLYADIGDEQSIEQSLSTFSSHVTRIVDILRSADWASLVLLDEVGAGTDPQEGAALSRAILQHLVDSRIYAIATTHYSELKTFAYATPRVENASVEFDTESLRPTYRLIIGLPGRSNALAIAERLGMPTSIIRDARGQAHPTERRVDELLEEIHQHLAQARTDRAESAQLRTAAERANNELRAKLASVERERRSILEEAEAEREGTISELAREADALRRELRGLRSERERLAAIEGRIAGLRGAGPARQQPAVGESAPFTIGDTVEVTSLGTTGIVRSIPTSGGAVEVEIAGKRVRVSPSQLVKRETPRPAPSPRHEAVAAGVLMPVESNRGFSDEWAPVESQLDLRGLTTEEARYRLDQYLNDAYMEGARTVRVIHGKGTGAVRQTVRDLLADHPLVASHQVAERHEGGEGATVVRLAS